MRWAAVQTTAVLLSAWVGGCAPTRFDDPLSAMLDRNLEPSFRMAALRQLGPVEHLPDKAPYLEALHKVAWSKHHPDSLRILAIDRLIEYDAPAFQRVVDEHIVELDRWAVLLHIFERAVAHNWTDFTATAVRSYARRSQVYTDGERAEREVLVKLNPGRTVQDVVYEVFNGLEPFHRLSHQVAAWTLLNRLMASADLRPLLASSSLATPLIVDLQEAAEVLDVLPPNPEGILWLTYLRSATDGDFWVDLSWRVATLAPSQRRGMALRHLSLLPHLSLEQRSLDRDAMWGRVQRRLESIQGQARHDRRRTSGESASPEVPTPQLPWADLAAIDLLVDLLGDHDLVSELFAQAEADRRDTTTEHGGVVRYEDDRWRAAAFPPALVAHDRKFYSSPQLIEAMYMAVAHYHFHAQDYHNGAFAGPGLGDLGFADRLRPTALVLTFLDRDTLNVDYYQVGDVVVDLGVIKR